MKAFDRICCILLSLLMLAVCGLAICFAFGVLPILSVAREAAYLVQQWWIQLIVCVIALIIIGIALDVMFVRTKRESVKTPQQIALSENGNVRIAVDAVNEVAVRSAKEDARVEEANCHVQSREDGLHVFVSMVLQHDTSIPETSEATIERIKSAMENICGIANAKVQVLIKQSPQHHSQKG